MSYQDKALVRSFAWVLAVLVVAAVFFYLIASFVSTGPEDGAADERTLKKVAENVRPVGAVHVGEAPAPAGGDAQASAGPARSGEQVYNAACMACHSAGVAGAPKLGDKGAWQPRVDKGLDTLVSSVSNGLNAMPAKGGCADCSDEELKKAVEYMLNQSGF